jgi:cellulose synthase/poly-beta-1,6-N-acetylglucosamine synthase-like glycosyltransferase
VVIVARNEERSIGSLLSEIAAQDLPNDRFEVVVVDDHSEDRTVEVVNAFIQSHPALSMKMIEMDSNEINPKKAALQRAVSTCQFRHVVATDADCSMGKHWLRTMATAFSMDGAEIIVGPVAYRHTGSWWSGLQSLEFLSLVGTGMGMLGLRKPVLANGANIAFTREAFEKAHESSELQRSPSGDDLQLLFAHTANAASIKPLLFRNALVTTPPQPSLSAFLQQRARWASKAKFYRDPVAVFLAYLVLILNVVWLLAPLGLLLDLRLFLITACCWGLKTIADLPLMGSISRSVGQRKLMAYFLPLAILYPLYIVIAGLAGIFGRFSWKGRAYRT